MDTRVPSGSWSVNVLSTRSARVTAVVTTLLLERDQDPPQARSEQRREMAVLGRLDETDPEALLLGDLGKAVEQDRLAGTPQADHGRLFPGRPATARRNATPKRLIRSSRPVSAGGGVPAPGRYGLRQLIHRFNGVYLD